METEARPTRDAVTALVIDTLRGVDTGSDRTFEDVDESTELLGRLDSLGLVTLIVDLEERLLDDLGIAVTLATGDALSRRHSPFRTVGTLSDYVVEAAGVGE